MSHARGTPDSAATTSRVVRVCDGAACFAATGAGSVEPVASAIGRVDGSVSVRAARCLGYCYAAPAALDGEAPCVGADLADQLTYRAPRNDPAVPVLCDSPVPVVTAGVLEEESAWSVWPRTIAAGDPSAVLAKVERSGLRETDGQTTARKWRELLAGPPRAVVVVADDEVEPGAYADRLLLERDPHRLLEGLALTCFAVGARQGLVRVPEDYPTARRRVLEAVQQAYAAGHLGRDVRGSGHDLEIEVAAGGSPPLPAGATALVHAVETVAAVPWVVRHGGQAYTRMGTAEESGTRLVSLSERFTRPGVYEVQAGVTARHVVQLLGRGLRDGMALGALQVGGPLGGFLGPDDLDLPLSRAGLSGRGMALGHGGIVAFDDRIPGDAVLRHLWTALADLACDECSAACRRGLELASRPDTVEARAEVLRSLCGGARCAVGRRAPSVVQSLVAVYGLPPWPA